MSECLKLTDVDLVFGEDSEAAFKALDNGKGREEIQKSVKQVVAVQKASLSVGVGEVLVLMGFSGSGKSSLLRCLNGMNGRGVGKLRGKVIFKDPVTGEQIDVIECKKNTL
jgi:glycine betaine/proline transport system ATP-binding protein